MKSNVLFPTEPVMLNHEPGQSGAGFLPYTGSGWPSRAWMIIRGISFSGN